MPAPIEIQAKPCSADDAVLGEGPLWDARAQLYWWIDIESRRLHCFRVGWPRSRTWQLDQIPGAVALRQGGGLVLALQYGFATLEPLRLKFWQELASFQEDVQIRRVDEDWRLRMIGAAEPDRPENRLNDGKIDPAGRYWVGSMRIDDHMSQFTGTLYSLEHDHTIRPRWGYGSIGVSNGMAWSRDARHFFYVDSPRRVIYRFDYDLPSGEVSNCTIAFQVPDELGYPDGMTIDVEDKLWVALWGAGRVARICPQRGEILAVVRMPVSIPTSCIFGGPGLDQLLVTTASCELSPQERIDQPLAGALFIADVGVRGIAPVEFPG
jgi:sugar lactone lactonase YvrE